MFIVHPLEQVSEERGLEGRLDLEVSETELPGDPWGPSG